MENRELKPCPFCSGKAEIKEPKGFYAFPCDSYWRVQCYECLARGAASKSKTGAIDAWNRRAGNGA
jgi:Lar family restriction alleviation protein